MAESHLGEAMTAPYLSVVGHALGDVEASAGHAKHDDDQPHGDEGFPRNRHGGCGH